MAEGRFQIKWLLLLPLQLLTALLAPLPLSDEMVPQNPLIGHGHALFCIVCFHTYWPCFLRSLKSENNICTVVK